MSSLLSADYKTAHVVLAIPQENRIGNQGHIHVWMMGEGMQAGATGWVMYTCIRSISKPVRSPTHPSLTFFEHVHVIMAHRDRPLLDFGHFFYLPVLFVNSITEKSCT